MANDSVLHAFESRFAELDSLLARVRTVRTPVLLYRDATVEQVDSLCAARLHDDLRAMRRKSGLEVTGQVYQRLDNTLGLDDEDQYSRYNTKIQGELGWDFFGSSLLQRKTLENSVRLENELQRIEQHKRLTPEIWERLQADLQQQYAGQIAAVLYARLANADLQNMAYNYTLTHEKEGNGRMLQALGEKMEIEYALAQLCDAARADGLELTLPLATSVHVDTVALFRELDDHNPDIRACAVREELLESRSRLTNYGHALRFTPFARVSHYLHSKGSLLPSSSSTNLDAGVRFTFPLYDDSAPKRKSMRTEKGLTALRRVTVHAEAEQHCRLLLVQLEQLNATVRTEVYHLRQMEQFLAIRRDAYRNSPQSYNYLLRLDEYSEYLKSVERLYRLLMQRNAVLLNLQRVTLRADFSTLLTETPV